MPERLPRIVAVAVLLALAAGFAWLALRPGAMSGPSESPRSGSGPADVLLEVRSGLDHGPLAGCRVTRTHGPDGEREVRTGPDGRCQLAVSAVARVRVAAPRHLSEELSLSVPGPRQVILEPTGSLDIRFAAPDGRGVPDVDVLLVPEERPVDPARLWEAPVWTRRTDAEGRAAWPELPAGRAYRWAVTSDHRVIPEPRPHHDPDAYAPTPPPDTRSSGLFVVPFGGRIRLEAVVSGWASVRGSLADASGPDAIVRIFEQQDIRLPNRTPTGGNTTRWLEAVAHAAKDGRFHFPALRPGTKQLTAVWTSGEQRAFASLTFVLAAGEEKDVGVLAAQAGHRLRGIVRLRGREALPPSAAANPPRAKLSLVSRRYEGPGRTLRERMLVDFDRPFVLTGLPAGSFTARAEVQDPAAFPGVLWKAEDSDELAIPEDGEFELTVEASAALEARLIVSFPPGSPAAPVVPYVFPEPADRREPNPPREERGVELPVLRPEPGGGHASLETRFPARSGRVVVWVFSENAHDPAGPNFFGEAKAEFRPGNPNEVRVMLGTGAILSGFALDALGRPYPNRVQLHADPFTDPEDLAVRSVAPSPDGSFLLVGIPPRRMLRFMFGDVRFESAGPGQESRIQIKLRN